MFLAIDVPLIGRQATAIHIMRAGEEVRRLPLSSTEPFPAGRSNDGMHASRQPYLPDL
ncbi:MULTISPECIES: hypothetical protein [Ralstonia]|nr:MULTISPECIES: hypothetical protein [unclassified Ralstonia]